MKNVYALQFTTSSRATISMRGSSNDVSLEYSYDGIDWNEWDLNVLKINLGDKLYIRGNNPRGLSHKNVKHYKFIIEGGKVSCSGNIMSLIDYKNLPNIIPCDYCFCELFSGCAALTTAPELPATTLAKSCYNDMFYGCSSLKAAPELPATKLAKDCYYQMFDGCTSLKNASELPVKTFKEYCQRHLSSMLKD